MFVFSFLLETQTHFILICSADQLIFQTFLRLSAEAGVGTWSETGLEGKKEELSYNTVSF